MLVLLILSNYMKMIEINIRYPCNVWKCIKLFLIIWAKLADGRWGLIGTMRKLIGIIFCIGPVCMMFWNSNSGKLTMISMNQLFWMKYTSARSQQQNNTNSYSTQQTPQTKTQFHENIAPAYAWTNKTKYSS